MRGIVLRFPLKETKSLSLVLLFALSALVASGPAYQAHHRQRVVGTFGFSCEGWDFDVQSTFAYLAVFTLCSLVHNTPWAVVLRDGERSRPFSGVAMIRLERKSGYCMLPPRFRQGRLL